MEGLDGGSVGLWGEDPICKIGCNCREKSGLEGMLHLSGTRGGSDYFVGRMGRDKAPGEELGREKGKVVRNWED